MKKYLPLIILFGVLICGKIYLAKYLGEKREEAEFCLNVSRTTLNLMSKTKDVLNMQRSMDVYYEHSKTYDAKLDSLEEQIDKEHQDIFRYFNDTCFYRKLNIISNWVFAFLILIISSIFYWYLHRKDEIHPKIFFVLIFNWLYLLYFICEKKKI